MTYILGIHDGHNCGAALCKDGEIVAAVCEERITRCKNEVGFPVHSIREVLRLGGICGGDLDGAVFASFFMHSPDHLRNLESWYAVGSAQQAEMETRRDAEYDKVIFAHQKERRINQAVSALGIPASKVSFVEHHTAHLAAAYHTSPYTHSPVLGITCDGAGDGISATVSICKNGKYERIATTGRDASLGKIYSRMTFLLGMKPWEDEYKVMGLAPYADQERANLMTGPFRSLICHTDNGMGFKISNGLSTNYCYEYLSEAFQRVRFDTVAGALQLFTTEMLTEMIRNSIEATGIKNVVCGGGVFMNVKANMAIAALPEIESFYVVPSAADESLAIGACLYKYHELTGLNGNSFNDLCLGGEFSAEDEESAIRQAEAYGEYHVPFSIEQRNDVDEETIWLIRRGKIIARFSGRMEWGARALGNRSILTKADDVTVTERLNKAIKKRDFWMPFAPSIQAEIAKEYFDDAKDLKPYYMTYAFETKEHNRQMIAAAIHPYDYTTRPQVVTEQMNPRYYNIVKECGGAILNTSFNLHGSPIVYSPADAVEVFLNSGLEYLALDHFLLKKEA